MVQGFTQLRSGKIAMDYRLRKIYFWGLQWFFVMNVFEKLFSFVTVEYIDLKGDIELFNIFTILVNMLIITNENKCSSGTGLLSWFSLKQFERFTCLYLIWVLKLDLHQFCQFLKYLRHYRYLNLTLQLQSPSSVNLSKKRTLFLKGGKDWALAGYLI